MAVRGVRDAGFSLVEVLVATVLLALSLAALAELFAISVRNNAVAKHGMAAAMLAAQKVEQLRARTDLAASPGQTLQQDHGAALTPHEPVRSFVERVFVLDFGTLIASGRTSEVFADSAVRRAYLGL